MGLTQTKLHHKVVKQDWPAVRIRLRTPTGRREACTRNPLGDLPLHLACYGGKAPPDVVEDLLRTYPPSVSVRNKEGFVPLDLARINYRETNPDRVEVLSMLGGQWERLAGRDGGEATFADGPPRSSFATPDEMISPPLPPEEVYMTSPMCVVCLDSAATHVVVPCGHLCLCRECAVRVLHRRAVGASDESRHRLCPVGRCAIGGIVSATSLREAGADALRRDSAILVNGAGGGEGIAEPRATEVLAA